MRICERLKEEYMKELGELIDELKEKSADLNREGSKDEAVFENIKLNIVDIFQKMFNISYNNSCKKMYPEDEEIEKLQKSYLAFFDKIPAPWKEKMAKDKDHNMMEECFKEQIKLETADQVKNLFIKHYDRFCKEA
jgi:hypothetical protein